MKKKIKRIFIILPILVVLAVACLLIYNYIYTPDISRKKIDIALEFCKKHHLNTDYCVFVDFSINAGKKRYVLYNLNTREVEYGSACANGLNRNEFSNKEGSHLSSLGKYKVTSIVGRMGIGEECIILEGLEPTNSNARKRQILIHSHKSVYYNPGTYPFNFFYKNLSWGCFVIDKRAFKKTKKISKPMLLWAYN
jgi:hypothetical protein